MVRMCIPGELIGMLLVVRNKQTNNNKKENMTQPKQQIVKVTRMKV